MPDGPGPGPLLRVAETLIKRMIFSIREDHAMDELDQERLSEALQALGETLAFRGQSATVAVIGGSGLLLLGAVSRATHDVDVVALVEGEQLARAQPLPVALRDAARDVADALGLNPNWFNPGPTSLLDFGLPAGFIERSSIRRYSALVVHVASRLDQIHFKLYAATDQGPRSKHIGDLRALSPARDELLAAARWCRTHDPSPGFLMSLHGALRLFEVEVSNEQL